jgi:hypothetical protein
VAEIKEFDRRTKHSEVVRALPDVLRLDSLQQARRIAPQLTRYHPQVHETVHTLAIHDARSTGSLPRFAAWCGIRI